MRLKKHKDDPSLQAQRQLTIFRGKGGWCKFARDVLGVHLDPRQEEILTAIQDNRFTVVKSGHARGKDFIVSVAALCFYYLCYEGENCPCRVIHTAPSNRQVEQIIMTEIKSLHSKAKIELGGEINATMLRDVDHGEHKKDPKWFLVGYKPADPAAGSAGGIEKWTGYHAPNIMVIISEASGFPDVVFNAIQGILTGKTVRLVMVGNPNITSGAFYRAFMDPKFQKFSLSCLDAPNVVQKKNIIPGQVDWEWVNDLVGKPGWTSRIKAEEVCKEDGDFQWQDEEGVLQWHRPSDLFRVKVLGMWPKESSSQLIPLSWLYSAVARFAEPEIIPHVIPPPRLGVDVAGMGADFTVFVRRHSHRIKEISVFQHEDTMQIAGRLVDYKKRFPDIEIYIDTIGEGAGVYSRLKEQGIKGVYSVKASEGAEDLHDITGERTFLNMRAYLHWAVRDALDPKLDACLSFEENNELIQDLSTPEWDFNSTGKIFINKKDEIKETLGRSPDWGDALANTYYPKTRKANFLLDLGYNTRA